MRQSKLVSTAIGLMVKRQQQPVQAAPCLRYDKTPILCAFLTNLRNEALYCIMKASTLIYCIIDVRDLRVVSNATVALSTRSHAPTSLATNLTYPDHKHHHL